MSKAFKAKCEKAATIADVSLVHYEETASPDDQFEDDGCLHIYKGGVWACFGIGQDLPGAEANEKVRKVMTALGLARKITDRVLVEEDEDEDEDEDETCECCGRPF